MPQPQPGSPAQRAQDLIALAQKLARESERQALLSESLATQADQLMDAGLRLLTASAAARPIDRQ